MNDRNKRDRRKRTMGVRERGKDDERKTEKKRKEVKKWKQQRKGKEPRNKYTRQDVQTTRKTEKKREEQKWKRGRTNDRRTQRKDRGNLLIMFSAGHTTGERASMS